MKGLLLTKKFNYKKYIPCLEDYFKKCRNDNQIVPQDFIIKIFIQLLSVLTYLYSNSIIH